MSSASIDRAPWWSRFSQAWTGFWLTPASPVPLHVVRVLAGLLFLAWLVPLASGYAGFFGVDGWFDKAAYIEAQEKNLSPYPIGWSLIFPLTESLGEGSFVTDSFFAVSIAVLVLFTLGIATRITAPLTWLVVVSHTANPALHYDGDDLFIVLAFYLMIGYLLMGLGTWKLPLLEKIFGPGDTMLSPLRRSSDRVSHGATLALRLLQVHFALIVVVSALHKLQFGTWWSGIALWYRMYPPQDLSPEKLRDMKAMAWTSLGFISLAGYMLLAWQLTFPLFAFRRSWRPVLIGGAALGWLTSFLLTGVPYFGPLYLTFCLGFVTADEWARLFGRFRPAKGSTAMTSTAKVESRIRPRSTAGR
ncbi:MAG TPA: hypothetical protein VHR72_13055 [Gemmataceae bacterium]|jgi:hypothetical protein|nr:hypothetical protein [Gemmataceae bacterium]